MNLNSRLNDNKMLKILLVIINFIAVQTFPVFTFDELLDASETPSFASLVANVKLPETFIVCSSSKEASFGRAPVYSIFGEDLSEWLTMVIQVIWGKTRLTIYWDGGFYHARDLQDPKLDFWYHTCLKIDLSKKEIDCSVNGVLFSKFVGINITNVPKNLIMNIGVGRGNSQFRGSVANIQVFKKGDIKEISAAPCKDREGTLLSWNPQLWRVTGPHWLLTEEYREIICAPYEHYKIAIPSKLTFNESRNICKEKLNNSVIPYPENHSALLRYVNWHLRTLPRVLVLGCGHLYQMKSPRENLLTFTTFLVPNIGYGAKLNQMVARMKTM